MPDRLCLLVLVVALACQGMKPPSQGLAQVGEVTITRADFDGFLEYQTKGQVSVKDASLELKRMVLRKLVVLELLVREARRVGFETRPLIRSHGGDLGWVLKKNNHGWEPEELIEAASRLQHIGDISAPIQLEHGWAIFRLIDQHAAESLAYDDVKDAVDASVRRVKFGRQTDDFIAQLRSRAAVAVYEDRLIE